MMVIMRSIRLTKAKETSTFPYCHSFTFIWLIKSLWPFKRGIKQNKVILGTTRSWPQLLNRSGHWIEVFITVHSWQFFWAFGHWLPNKGWLLNRELLNRGSTVDWSVKMPWQEYGVVASSMDSWYYEMDFVSNDIGTFIKCLKPNFR